MEKPWLVLMHSPSLLVRDGCQEPLTTPFVSKSCQLNTTDRQHYLLIRPYNEFFQSHSLHLSLPNSQSVKQDHQSWRTHPQMLPCKASQRGTACHLKGSFARNEEPTTILGLLQGCAVGAGENRGLQEVSLQEPILCSAFFSHLHGVANCNRS